MALLLRLSGLRHARYCSLIAKPMEGGVKCGFMPNKTVGTYFFMDTHAFPIARSGAEYFYDVRLHRSGYLAKPDLYDMRRPDSQPSVRRSFDWYLIDAAGLDVYTAAALLARAAFKQFDPSYSFTGDNFPNVVMINCSRVVMTDNEWEYKPYWKYDSSRPEERVQLVRAKQVYQRDPSYLIWIEAWKFFPATIDYLNQRNHKMWRRANVQRHIHMFNGEEHPYEHFYPVDVTDKLLLQQEEVKPFRQYGVLSQKHSSILLHKFSKHFELQYAGRAPPESPAGGKWYLEGKTPAESSLAGSSRGRKTY